jgi:LysM repeat protein
VSGSTVGIKIADGSYYPILEQGFTGRKKLTLTTVADSQTRVQIDLYRGDGGGLEKARYIGSLLIENIPPAPRGEPEIHLSIGLDADGELDAEASDASTGERQTFSISLTTLSDDETYEVPEFRVEEEQEPAVEALPGLDEETGEEPGPFSVGDEEETGEVELEGLEESVEAGPAEQDGEPEKAGPPGERESFDFEEPPLTGESYPTGSGARKKERARRRGPGTFLVVLFCLLGALLLGVVGYVVYRAVTGQPVQLLPSAGTPAAPAEQAPAAEAGAAAGTSQAASGQEAAAAGEAAAGGPAAGESMTVETTAGEAATTTAAEKPSPPKGVTYRIRKGDTLWDISATYYRNPWLYLRLARANSIKNPDLIFAGAKLFIPED